MDREISGNLSEGNDMNDSILDMDQETSDLWEGEMKSFFDKGGFVSLLKNIPTATPALDLNLLIPTLTDIGKLNIQIKWVVEGIIPPGITTLTAPGGGLKTTLCTQLGVCIVDGRPFAGLRTRKMPVYLIDFEGPLSLWCDKSKVYGPSDMKIWHLSNSFPPPRLDTKEDWKLYKALFPGLLIIDTLRSAQLLDENSSKDMALIMNRLKELREFGHTILLIHHAPKANERTYRGSTAISDLSDHCLVLERVREVGSEETVDDDEDNDLPLRLGVRGKTRFAASSIFLRFDPLKGFTRAQDPTDELLSTIQDILGDHELNQSAFFKLAKETMRVNRRKFLSFLRKGEGRFWTKNKSIWKNQTVYCSVVHNENQPCNSQLFENTELSSCPDAKKTTEPTASCSVVPSCSSPLRGEQTGTVITDLLEEEDEGE
jgi:hypothetical protein